MGKCLQVDLVMTDSLVYSVYLLCSRFLHISVGAPGRVHDARVLANSGLLECIAPGYQILGDAAYPISASLITPYTHRVELNARDTMRNKIHSSIRMMVERAFGILKKRFQILKFVESTDLNKIKHIVLACVILHNICIRERDEIDITIDAALLEQDTEITAAKSQIREDFFRTLMGENEN